MLVYLFSTLLIFHPSARYLKVHLPEADKDVIYSSIGNVGIGKSFKILSNGHEFTSKI